jgi:PAS domain-containing protein
MAGNLRKLAELTEKLNSRDQHLRYFVRYLPVPVAMMDKNRRYLLCSDSWAQRYKLNVEEVQGHKAERLEGCQTIPWYYEDGTLGGEIAFSEALEQKGDADE